MNKICAIFAAGDYSEDSLPDLSGCCILAVDAGLDYLDKHDIKPDIIIGDFDSRKSVPDGANVLRYPVEKDDTDTMLAIKYGISIGCKEFRLYGCLGGQLDHTIANLQALTFLCENNVQGFIFNGNETVTAIKNSSITLRNKKRFSVFSLCGVAEGVSIKGAKYNIDNADIAPEFPIGVSNKCEGDETVISVKKGVLHIIWYS